MRPPSVPSIVVDISRPNPSMNVSVCGAQLGGRGFAFGPLIERRFHSVVHALLPQRLFVFRADIGVFQPIRHRGAAGLGELDGTVIDRLLARWAGLATGRIGAEPGAEA